MSTPVSRVLLRVLPRVLVPPVVAGPEGHDVHADAPSRLRVDEVEEVAPVCDGAPPAATAVGVHLKSPGTRRVVPPRRVRPLGRLRAVAPPDPDARPVDPHVEGVAVLLGGAPRATRPEAGRRVGVVVGPLHAPRVQTLEAVGSVRALQGQQRQVDEDAVLEPRPPPLARAAERAPRV